MSFTITYKVLFEVNIYHHYFLDDGDLLFDDSPELKLEQLNKYFLDDFITIIPSEKTLTKFIGQKIIMKKTAKGFVVSTKAEKTAPDTFNPFIQLNQNDTFTFLIYAKDALFENYSTVPGNPLIPFHFANTKINPNDNNYKPIDLDQLPLTTAIKDYSIEQDTFDIIDSNLTPIEKQKLLGVITLKMNADEPSQNIINVDGSLKNTPKTFKIQFLNRHTNWVYNNAKDGSFIYATPSTHPLVKNGIIINPELEFDDKKLPSAVPNRLLFVKDINGNITETISEIFI
ncbi:hypothetical protein [Ulvibacter antarcticus]|uniref:Uncharacterized protein n=1 Tax=Ulvibacter antarcticus TaxID=442714 RepID=A0A3L9YL55_9FLAO|nr:hypothetical protein [Ulvibacter antarcticus]RMA58875.1 hypothetical protein BXY75_2255 [Ulvibacter antarcticus]